MLSDDYSFFNTDYMCMFWNNNVHKSAYKSNPNIFFRMINFKHDGSFSIIVLFYVALQTARIPTRQHDDLLLWFEFPV